MVYMRDYNSVCKTKYEFRLRRPLMRACVCACVRQQTGISPLHNPRGAASPGCKTGMGGGGGGVATGANVLVLAVGPPGTSSRISLSQCWLPGHSDYV